jgi:hypothetical protein
MNKAPSIARGLLLFLESRPSVASEVPVVLAR